MWAVSAGHVCLFFGGHERKLPRSPPQTIRWFLFFIQGFWFSSSQNGPTFQKRGGMKRRESKNDLGPQQGLSVQSRKTGVIVDTTLSLTINPSFLVGVLLSGNLEVPWFITWYRGWNPAHLRAVFQTEHKMIFQGSTVPLVGWQVRNIFHVRAEVISLRSDERSREISSNCSVWCQRAGLDDAPGGFRWYVSTKGADMYFICIYYVYI